VLARRGRRVRHLDVDVHRAHVVAERHEVVARGAPQVLDLRGLRAPGAAPAMKRNARSPRPPRRSSR
jgi:hypothetical protein